MDRQQTIELVVRQLGAGVITRDDLLYVAGASREPSASTPTVEQSDVRPRNLTHVFYSIGGIIALVGVAVLVAQNWEEIGFGGRVIVTLGIALVTYLTALGIRNDEHSALSQVLFTIAAALAPLGVYVLLDQAGRDFTLGAQVGTALMLGLMFSVAFVVSRRPVLVLITIAFATWAYYAIILRVLSESAYYFDSDVLKWATMLIGFSYLCIGHGYRVSLGGQINRVTKHLYGVGTLAVLGAGISIGGVFDVAYIAFIFAAFYGSVYLKSGEMLSLGAFFLVAHIINLTSEYFVDSIGWPVALIGVGFLVIGVGYVTVYLNRRYVNAG